MPSSERPARAITDFERRLAAGDDSAVERLLDEYAQGAMLRLRHDFGSKLSQEEREECFNTAAASILAARGSYNPALTSAQTYLNNKVWAAAKSYLKKRNRFRAMLVSDVSTIANARIDSEPAVYQGLLDDEERAAMHRAIRGLPYHYQTVLLAKIKWGSDYVQRLADAGWSRESIKTWGHRAVRQLSRDIGRDLTE